MASIQHIGNAVRAQVRRAGQSTLTKSFSVKKYGTLAEAEAEAKKWAMKQEVDINDGKKIGVHGKTGLTIGEAVDRYLDENLELGRTTIKVLNYLKREIGNIVIAKMTDQDIVDYIRARRFSAASGGIHFSLLRSLLKMAKIGWQYHVPDILDTARDRLTILKLIGKSKERTRRPTKEEIQMLLDYDFGSSVPMNDVIRFSIATAMRISEITRIEHKTVVPARNEGESATVIITDRKHPKKKKGNHHEVPLLDEAYQIIKQQPISDVDGRIFPYQSGYISNLFINGCKRLGIVDLHLHDLRHEGTSRLFEMGLDIEQVALFTGHEDWKMLKRYTHLEAKNIRPKESIQKTPKMNAVEDEVKPAMDPAMMKEFEEFLRFKKMQEMMTAAKAA